MVRVLGNTWMPIGVGGNFMPGGTSGTSAEYYKCASVSSGASQPKGYNLTMSFIDVIDFDYATEPTVIQLTMTDTTKTGLDREWVSADGAYTLKKYTSPGEGYISWGLYKDNGNTCSHYISSGLLDQNKITTDAEGNSVDQREPWEISQLYSEAGFMDTKTISWVVSEAATGANTWSGYKAVFDSTAGTWSFESDVTAGLAYTSVTPVVGVIYTIDALVTVASVYTGFYATSSPLNPGSNNSGVWEITASSFLDSNRNAYKAFDEDLNSDRGCWHSQSGMPQWIQWRNTESKVLIKSYFLQNRSGGAGDFYPVEWTLSGSDDGVDWTELDNVVIQNSDTASGSKTLRNLASNNTAYYYHRITVTKAYNNSYATIGFLQAFNYLQE